MPTLFMRPVIRHLILFGFVVLFLNIVLIPY